ncbi:MAG: dihydroorotate dehydrogenase electron transfer subunit [Bacillota bacterium]
MQTKPALIHYCELIENTRVTAQWHCLRLRAPKLAVASPGQFVHLRVGSHTDPLLRRPISIHHADESSGEIRLLVRPAGAGTEFLVRSKPGTVFDVMGPLGNGFPHLNENRRTLLVGGGIGMAPLYFLAGQRRQADLPFELLIGAASAAELPPHDYFCRCGFLPLVATEDGSRGVKGTAIDLLEQRLRTGGEAVRLYACGPPAMLSRVVDLGRSYGLPTHISLEAHLACAVGACLGCSFPFKKNGQIEYRRVCRDGPVFAGEEVYFET